MITIHFPTGKKVVLPTANFVEAENEGDGNDEWKFYTKQGGTLLAVASRRAGVVIEFQTTGGAK